MRLAREVVYLNVTLFPPAPGLFLSSERAKNSHLTLDIDLCPSKFMH